jgi:hypothetical protein
MVGVGRAVDDVASLDCRIFSSGGSVLQRAQTMREVLLSVQVTEWDSKGLLISHLGTHLGVGTVKFPV